MPTDASDKSVTWTSSDSSIATVNDNGTITAIAIGTATITVKTNDGGKTATCRVSVTPIHVTSVKLNKSSTTLVVGESETLTATVLPADATDKSVTWTSSDSSVATVNSNGTITAVAIGTATITVKTNDGGKTATCWVSVTPVHVTRISLNKTSTTLVVGNTETLTATVLPEDATDKSVTWTSSNSSVATVNSNGKITAVGQGNATIIATSVDNPNAKAFCQVKVIKPEYINITAKQDATLELINEGENNPNLQYSDDQKIWHDYSGTISIPAGSTFYLRGNNQSGWSLSDNKYSHFNIAGNVSISGNVMALLDKGTGALSSIPNDYCFNALFHHTTGITSVSEDFLPATGLTKDCYVNMFLGCSSLTTAPDLPATTLAEACYSGMFNDCTSLTTAPALPATTLATKCYASMFGGCTSLITAPSLPATTLADACYVNMFSHCESLTTAPALPATTLAANCYSGMFFTCSSLVTAPDLPAKDLLDSCYKYIFAGCVNLTSIRIGYTGTVARAPAEAFSNWVNLVPEIHGTFYYKGTDTLESFGLPSSWTINPN